MADWRCYTCSRVFPTHDAMDRHARERHHSAHPPREAADAVLPEVMDDE